MIKLIISLIIINILLSCEITNSKKNIKTIINKKDSKIVFAIENDIGEKEINSLINDNGSINKLSNNKAIIKYVLGDPYTINGVEYVPLENYYYDEIGLASYYGKELHKKKTLNNDLNMVTDLLGRHKTLPLPSIVKITNLDNGLYLTIKINDRHEDNSFLIQVSRKTAQLLRFYKNKIAKVRVQVLSDASKQMKIVTQSMNDTTFNDTINSAPTESISISNLDTNTSERSKVYNADLPIEIGFEEIENKNLYLKIYGFTSYDDAQSTISDLEFKYKFTTHNEGSSYSVMIGPIESVDANNLVLSFISKGYKKTEIILK